MRVVAAVTLWSVCALALVAGQVPAPRQAALSLEGAQRQFYNARFEEAAETARELLKANPDDLAVIEVRTSALHFQLRRLLGEPKDKKAALARCAACPPVLEAFLADVARGRRLALARLEQDPTDEEARFFLGKIDLNYLWLQLSTLGRKTGWSEYWEAKRMIEAVLKENPQHVRARVARAWMDYIVGTRVPWGTRWLMGGGSKSKGMQVVREAAQTEADFFTEVEAMFGLWEMLTREGRRAEAMVIARELLEKFPQNRDLTKFVEGGETPEPR